MAYGVRYRLEFNSEIYNKDVRIDILENDYAGAVQVKKMGGAPQLSISESAPIKGGSLSLLIEASEDGELQNLYTTDNKKFKVVVYSQGIQLWQGYILPELYAESYVAAPYDVAVTASDGLGILKNLDFETRDERIPVLQVIKDCLIPTGLNLDFEVFCSVHVEGQSTALPFIVLNTIDKQCFAGKNCYEVLEDILGSMGAVIYQKNNRWIIQRLNDVGNNPYVIRWNDLQLIERRSVVRSVMGKQGVDDTYNFDTLSMVIEPAKKSIEIEQKISLRDSMLKNSSCKTDEAWAVGDKTDKPRNGYITYNGAKVKVNWEYYKLGGRVSDFDEKFSQMNQVINVEADPTSKFQLKLLYLAGVTKEVAFGLRIINTAACGEKSYLSVSGWTKEESEIPVRTSGGSIETKVAGPDKESFNSALMTFESIPHTGTLQILIVNRWIIKEVCQDQTMGLCRGSVLIGGCYLTNTGNPATLKTTLVMNSGASTSASAVTVSLCDAPVAANAHLLINNHFVDINGKITSGKKWQINGKEFSSYLTFIAYDYAQFHGVRKYKLSGSLANRAVLNSDLIIDKFSGKRFFINKIDCNLLADEIAAELIEMNDYATDVVEGDIEVGGGGESSGTGGNSNTNDRIGVFEDHDHAGKEVRPAILVLPKTYDAATQSGKLKPGEQAVINSADGTIDVGFLSRFKYNAETDTVEILSNFAAGKDVIAGGAGSSGSGGGGGVAYNRLDSFSDYTADKAGWVLSAGLGDNLNVRVKALENKDVTLTFDTVVAALGYTPFSSLDLNNTLKVYALKNELHSHGNKSLLDTIESKHLLTDGQRTVLAALSVVSENGVNLLKSALGFFSTEDISAGGSGLGSGGGAAYKRLDAWVDYTVEKAGFVLSAALGNDLNVRVKALEAGAVSLSWDNISGKPATFTPSAHNHPFSQITGLQAALDGKQPVGNYVLASSLNDYLPLTGGTLTGKLHINTGEEGIVLKRLDQYYPQIRFENSVGWMGNIGFTGKNNPAFYNVDTSTWHSLYSTDNFNPNSYLPLTGGTMIGGLSFSNLSDANLPSGSGFRMLYNQIGGLNFGGNYMNIASFITQYTGFQLKTWGGGTEDLGFRKRVDNNTWTPWRNVWHDGNFTPSDYFPKAGNGIAGFDPSGRYRMINNQGFACTLTTGITQECMWIDGSNNFQIGRVDNGGTLNLRGSNFNANGQPILHSGNYTSYTASRSEAMIMNTSPSLVPGNIQEQNVPASFGFGYSANGFPTTGSYIAFGGFTNCAYKTMIQAEYNTGNELYFWTRNNDGANVVNPFRRIWHDGNSNSSDVPWNTGNLYVKGLIQAYNYGRGGSSVAAITIDKPGAYAFGIGPDGTSQRIRYGLVAGMASPSWVGAGVQHCFEGEIFTGYGAFYANGRGGGVSDHNVAIRMYDTSHVGIHFSTGNGCWGIYGHSDTNLRFGWMQTEGSTGYYPLNLSKNGDLTVVANISAGGEITAGTASDRRLKDNVLTLKNATKILNQLRPVEFDYNDEAFRLNPNRRHRHSYSFVAQELAEIDTFKCSVNPIYDNYLGIEDKHFTPWLVAGFQEMDVRVLGVENELDNLRKRVHDLETMLGINEIAA